MAAFTGSIEPHNQDYDFQSYCERLEQLFVFNNVVEKKHVQISNSLREDVLEFLHNQHAGIVRIKTKARSDVWWPGLDKDKESKNGDFEACQIHGNKNKKFNLTSRRKTASVWNR